MEAYAADSWKVTPRVTLDYGLRWSRFENPYDLGDTISSFDRRRSIRRSAPTRAMACCCRRVQRLSGRGSARREGRTRTARSPKTNNYFAPRFGAAWDVSGNGKTALRAGVGQFYQRESLQNGLNLGFNPPFNRVLVGSRTLDSNAEPFQGAFSTNDGIPQYGLDTSGKMGYNWQWNVSVQREIAPQHHARSGLRRQQGRELLRPFDVNQVPPATRTATACLTAWTTSTRAATAMHARRSGRTACSATTPSPSSTIPAAPPTTLCRHSS